MKFHHLLLAGIVPVMAMQIACDRKPKLDNDKAKLSYAIGQNIAQNIKSQNIEIDPKVVGYSVTQGLKGEKPDVSPEEQQKVIASLQQQAQAKA